VKLETVTRPAEFRQLTGHLVPDSGCMPTSSQPPGEPVSTPLAATNAPLPPTALKGVTVARPAALSTETLVVDAPDATPLMRLPCASKRFTASPSARECHLWHSASATF